VSWFAKIRRVAVLGAVITTGLLAGTFLSVSSAKERKDRRSPPASKGDGKAPEKRKHRKPDADKVRRASPIPRDYVE
jgi:hypothetical protein